MAIEIPENLDINPFGCRWDPIDPHLCFDENSCGCFLSPCDYFNVKAEDCELDVSDTCCTQIETCVPL